MAALSPFPFWKIIDTEGTPIPGALLYTFVAGTDTPATTYVDAAGTQATNPVVADADGGMTVWLGSGSYKFVLTDGVGATLFDPAHIEGNTIQTVDNISVNGNTGSAGTGIIVETIADLRAIAESTCAGIGLATVEGYYAAGDGGGGLFYWHDSDTTADDGGAYIRPDDYTGAGCWRRICDAELNVRQWGAKGTGVDNDGAKVNAAGTYAANQNHQSIVFDAGNYLLSVDIPQTVNVKLLSYAYLTRGGNTLTLSGSDVIIDENDLTKHFDETDTVVFKDGMTLKPQWWGAKADGSTDDTSKIQAAAACLPVGGTLYIPPTDDSYLVTDLVNPVITVLSNRNYRGDGAKSLFKCDPDAGNVAMLKNGTIGSQLSNIRIEGLAFEAPASAPCHSPGEGIYINCDGGYIRDCIFTGLFTYAIRTAINNFEVSGCKSTDSYFYIYQYVAATVKNNQIEMTSADTQALYGICITPAATATPRSINVTGNRLVGCNIGGTIPDTTTTIIHTNENEIYLNGASLGGYNNPACISILHTNGYVQVARNTVYSNDVGGGISIGDDSSAQSCHHEVAENTIRMFTVDVGGSHNGINVNYCSAATLKGNNIKCVSGSSTDDGIAVTNSSGIYYKGNVIINYPGDTLGQENPFVQMASAESLNVGTAYKFFQLTTNTTIKYISTTGKVKGDIIYIQVRDTTDTIIYHRAGSVPTGYAAVSTKSQGDTTYQQETFIGFIYNGTYWVEMSTLS